MRFHESVEVVGRAGGFHFAWSRANSPLLLDMMSSIKGESLRIRRFGQLQCTSTSRSLQRFNKGHAAKAK